MPAIDLRGALAAAPRTAVANRRWVVPASTLPVLAIAALSIALPRAPDVPTEIDLTALAASIAPLAAPEALDGPQNVEVTVQRNDTLDRIFRSVGIDNATLAELRTVPDVRKAIDILRPGDIITLTHADGVLQSLNRRISDTLTLSVARANDGFAVNFIENPLEIEVAGARARIETSLFDAGREAGMSAQTVMVLANEIFGWDIDFANDIHAGDDFSVLYQRKFQDGAYVSDGRVLAAEFVNRGKTHRAVWFESADGSVKGYYTPDGKGMRKAFLRAPLDFTRVSSGFNPNRRHPITGKVRAHKGIDFAAPTGTPIYAAGEGRIEFAGRKGGYGNAVIVNHGRGITTLYGHMSRFGKAARSGRAVRQGEIIGYVGSTGASTGPHLHYEYRVQGVHKNPANIVLPNTEIPSRYAAEFRTQAGVALAQLKLANSAPGTRLADNR
ncbi:MAG: peptidoglycan DD-metalloendopeptidase family protein [Steroidobacteraceae bacterium]|nr:peptidoglycan DD-metalloendopeptidase family protein [Steroidobacteraceae bacterium]